MASQSETCDEPQKWFIETAIDVSKKTKKKGSLKEWGQCKRNDAIKKM